MSQCNGLTSAVARGVEPRRGEGDGDLQVGV
jgi:hypothetical protein